jgi:hypothetical protein
LVTPGTILRWHHRVVAKKWMSPDRLGRLPVGDAVAVLVERMAREDYRWGHQRIQGEFLKLGHGVEASTIRCVLPVVVDTSGRTRRHRHDLVAVLARAGVDDGGV